MTSQRTEALSRFKQQMADYARGERLTKLRGGHSQEDIAHELGVSAKTLRSWEHGGKIRWHNAKRVGEFYGIDPEELVSREDPDEEESAPVLLGRQSQLDRMEEKLDWIISAWAETIEGLEPAPPSLEPEAGEPSPPSPARSESSRRSTQRTPASS